MKEVNTDKSTVDGFGDQWGRFDQSLLEGIELSSNLPYWCAIGFRAKAGE